MTPHSHPRFGIGGPGRFRRFSGPSSSSPAAPQAANPPLVARGPDGDQPRRQGRAGLAARRRPRPPTRSTAAPRPARSPTLVTPAGYTETTLRRHDRRRTAPPTSTRSAPAGTAAQSGAGPARDGDAARRARARPATRIVRRELLPRHDRVEGARRRRSWYPSGIEGFLSASSVDAGGSVDLRVTTGGWDVPYHVEIYRTGALRRRPGPPGRRRSPASIGPSTATATRGSPPPASPTARR